MKHSLVGICKFPTPTVGQPTNAFFMRCHTLSMAKAICVTWNLGPIPPNMLNGQYKQLGLKVFTPLGCFAVLQCCIWHCRGVYTCDPNQQKSITQYAFPIDSTARFDTFFKGSLSSKLVVETIRPNTLPFLPKQPHSPFLKEGFMPPIWLSPL